MSLLEHLEELRRRLIYALVAIVVGFGLAWNYAEAIFKLMERPIIEALRANQLSERLVYTSPTEPFNIYLKIGLIAGIFVASPAILYQVWMFLFFTVLLFLSGGYFGYRIVYPAALTFLIDYGREFQPMITVGEYTDLFLTVVAGLGIVFELPTLVFFLALMGVVDAGFLWRNIRYAVLIMFFVAAILTPTTDILNLCIFAGPLLVLYLFSIGIAWLVHPKRRRKAVTA
jgi:sec-independent protein translocase protein TatC